MAVRLDASNEHYSRTSGSFPTNGVLTTCLWAVLDVDRNTSGAIWTAANAGGDQYWALYNGNGDGTTMVMEIAAGSMPGSVNMTIGTWYFFALWRTGTGVNNSGWLYGPMGSALTSQVFGSSIANWTATREYLGTNLFNTAGGWINGRIAAFKQWNAALSIAEIEQERWSMMPVRWTNLFEWYPFVQGGTVAAAQTDYSGNGRTLAGGTNSVTADGPPIAWRQGRRRLWVPQTTPGGANILALERSKFRRIHGRVFGRVN